MILRVAAGLIYLAGPRANLSMIGFCFKELCGICGENMIMTFKQANKYYFKIKDLHLFSSFICLSEF